MDGLLMAHLRLLRRPDVPVPGCGAGIVGLPALLDFFNAAFANQQPQPSPRLHVVHFKQLTGASGRNPKRLVASIRLKYTAEREQLPDLEALKIPNWLVFGPIESLLEVVGIDGVLD